MNRSLLYLTIRGTASCFFNSFFNLKVINREKLIEEGPCLIVANHQSFLDPPLIGALYRNEVFFLARKTLFDAPGLKQALPYCNTIPVDQTRPDPASIIQVLRTVKNGGRIVIFPEGSRCPDGQIHDAMPGIGLILSKLATVPVQPVRIEGAYDCLPIHSSKLKFRPITLSVGDPIQFTPEELKAKGRDAQRAIGKKIMDAIRALPTEV
ncbi:MAG: 1-acyl-sn-glycerol-3-phosphate acyltransferase [Akkermansia sp.]|nr:1-acyl-sn-glycerol-3-phosphate acyltransferase [Akkermansia sp.]